MDAQAINHPEMMGSNYILDEFKTCTQLQYNGQLVLSSAKGYKWIFYYRLGRIVWATGGTHPFRRWRRLMAQHCPQIDIDKIQLRQSDIAIDYWDYRLLDILYKKQRIQREQIQAIVENTLAEILFDLAQETKFISTTSEIYGNTLRAERSHDVILEAPMSFTSADVSMKQMQDSWNLWTQAGLANIVPELAPVITRPEQLQELVSPLVYKNFVLLINGKLTLRELAVKMKQNLLPISRSLLPYILKGIIELVEVPDLPLVVTETTSNSPSAQSKKAYIPLVACVDDSPQVGKIMGEIITAHGLRFITIQDAIQALPILIKEKPDLIFLDLIMPVASGYEICTQLRRISTFANTPVIILTGNDGLLDRVRAKVVGSTDFLTKPVTKDKVMRIISKYLTVQAGTTVNSQMRLDIASKNT